MKRVLLFLISALAFQWTQAQVIAPSAEEMLFAYRAKFISPVEDEDTLESLAYNHSQYLFGVFHSPFVIGRFGLNANKVGGIGAPSSDVKIKILSNKALGDGRVEIEYALQGKALVHNTVSRVLASKQVIELFMPLDVTKVYLRNCTDSHYPSFGDYWYFWDPYRVGCENLKKAPATDKVQIHFKALKTRKLDTRVRLDLLRGNNDNGEDFLIYAMHGFESSARDPEDAGRLNFKEFNESMVRRGFAKAKGANTWGTDWVKSITLASGKIVNVTVRSQIFNSEINADSARFAQAFKEAVETADVIIYLGHSGLGGNLDIQALEQKAGGRFQFNARKRQIFYFDSCSSYSYYLQPFAAEKSRAKIDVMTNGLSSYFHTTSATLGAFFDYLLNPSIQDVEWHDLLEAMEKPLRGGSYLLNVGGV